MYTIGYDIGSSSIKAALVNIDTGETVGIAQYPETEMEISAPQPGWAEQQPEVWWEAVGKATQKLLKQTKVSSSKIVSIGISYQMHGLVLIDQDKEVLRPSIIWCDSRAVEIGATAFEQIGPEKSLSHCLNSPGNFTASKLAWVKQNEPETYARIYKVMLPGDYIAMKFTGEVNTTISGLSEGVLWDFQENKLAKIVLDTYGIDPSLFPTLTNTFGKQGTINQAAAKVTGLNEDTQVGYRAGDQPNNALSLGVFHPGEIAATGGTSGVVYAITDKYVFDNKSRVNGFAHVNHNPEETRIGILLCINGAGIQYAWMRKNLATDGISYEDMEKALSKIPIGSEGLRILPFGNGAERILNNAETGAQINNIQFNRHSKAHFYRAALEGIAFSFVYGFQLLKDLGIKAEVIKVGNDNLFQSPVFAKTIANLLNCRIEVLNTTGAVGAAKAGAFGAGYFSSLEEAITVNKTVKTYPPNSNNEAYVSAYEIWRKDLEKML